jgi:hypothetical protein
MTTCLNARSGDDFEKLPQETMWRWIRVLITRVFGVDEEHAFVDAHRSELKGVHNVSTEPAPFADSSLEEVETQSSTAGDEVTEQWPEPEPGEPGTSQSRDAEPTDTEGEAR